MLEIAGGTAGPTLNANMLEVWPAAFLTWERQIPADPRTASIAMLTAVLLATWSPVNWTFAPLGSVRVSVGSESKPVPANVTRWVRLVAASDAGWMPDMIGTVATGVGASLPPQARVKPVAIGTITPVERSLMSTKQYGSRLH